MHLQQLHLKDFRNFAEAHIRLSERLNFFLGENGQGKTNLLESVYLLSRGSSFRAGDTHSLVRKSGDSVNPRARITARFEKRKMRYDVEFNIEDSRKTALVNQKKVTSSVLLSHFPTVLFSPESLAVIKGGPEQRRALVDELIVTQHSKQARLLREFTKCLRARNRILKNLSEGLGPNVAGTDWTLDSLNRIYFVIATHLTNARLQALKAIQSEFIEAMRMILEGSPGGISVDYLISDESALEWSESEIFDALRKRHQELASREIAAGASLVGPHKHDIKFLFAGNDSRFYCSQGQQRALILALKIAQIVYHYKVHQTYPILLLDDVLSELDLKKRNNLMRFLEGISAQVLLTATDLTWSEGFDRNRNSVFAVSNGRIETQAF